MKKVTLILLTTFLCICLTSAVLAEGYPEFDFEKKTVTLNSGYEMPILGLGMFSLSDSEAENSTYWAMKAGFRLIDTARIYGNEAAVGRGLRRAIDEGIVTREEVFITIIMIFDRNDNKPVIALLGEHAGFITGTDMLIDGGTIAAIRTGQYKLGR